MLREPWHTARLTRDRVQVQAIKAYNEARIEAGIMGSGLPLRALSCSVVNEEVLATPPPQPERSFKLSCFKVECVRA